MSARLEDVLAAHHDVTIRRGKADRRGVALNQRMCTCGEVLPWEPESAQASHRAHVAAEVRAWLTERLADEELRESVVRSIYGDGLDGAHDIATAALTTIAEHLTNEQEASRG